MHCPSLLSFLSLDILFIFVFTFYRFLQPASCITDLRTDAVLNQKSNQLLKLHYGAFCSGNNECNGRESLVCINQTCQCSSPSQMTYEPARGLCVGLAGSPCIYHSSEKRVPFSRRSQCVKYASCEKDSNATTVATGSRRVCRCWSSFFQDEQGLCHKKREYLGKCDHALECNERKGLICNKQLGMCVCENGKSTYNPDKERCVGLPHRDCSNFYQECVEHYRCRDNVCKCKYIEVKRDNGTLTCDPGTAHRFGKPCKDGCGPEEENGLRCLEGKCKCKNPDYQIYDFERRICVSKIGGPCTLPISHPSITARNNSKFDSISFPVTHCVAYANCQDVLTSNPGNSSNPQIPIFLQMSPYGICECDPEFTPTKKGFCSLPFGAECDYIPSTSKSRKEQHECSAPLKCVAGKCGCQNEVDVWENGKCSRPIGALCWKNSDCESTASCGSKIAGKNGKLKLPGRCSWRKIGAGKL